MDHVSTAERAASDCPPKLKAKASNSIFAFPGNGRTAAARRFRDLVAGMLADLGVTERDLTHTTKLQLRHTALLAVEIEQAKAGAARGESVVARDELIRMEGRLDMKLWTLGLLRRKRQDLGRPEDVLDYARRKRQERPDA